MIWLLVIPAVAQVLVVVWVAFWTAPSGKHPDPEAHGAGFGADPGRSPHAVCLVAARNEENNLDRCLEALSTQTHPIPVVVIDDHSEDRTGEVVESWMARFDGRLSLVSGGPGKAMALAAGMKTTVAMNSEVVLTTDADCAPEPDWAAGMLRRFDAGGGATGLPDQARTMGVLGGCTMIQTRGFLSRLEALDWAILLATASAASSAGFPLTAMGNNMALRRSALERVGGFEAVADTPTEDYALFRGISRFALARLDLARDVLNWTEPAGSVTAIVSQRRRWAAGGMRGGPAATLRGVTIMILGLLALVGPYVLLAAMPFVGASLLLVRWLAHAFLVRRVSRALGIRLPIVWVPLHDVLMTAYTVMVPLSLLLSPSIRWKGRRAAAPGDGT